MQNLSVSQIVPNAVSRIKLKWALESCGKYNFSECIKQSSATKLFVKDDKSLGYTDWQENACEDDDKCFVVHNANSIVIVLLPLDNRIITSEAEKKGGVADCALLTEKEMSFVEFKTNAYSTEFIKDYDTKAAAQLWHTYSLISEKCQSKGIILSDNVYIDFYVVFDKNLDVTSASASRQSLMAEFLVQHKLPLFFYNEKVFK